jgi:hypothetical protein
MQRADIGINVWLGERDAEASHSRRCLRESGAVPRISQTTWGPLTLPSHGFKYVVPGAHEDGI